MGRELSVLIPARNEEWLARTVEDLLASIEADTEILIGLDGAWADPVIADHPRVKIFHVSEPIGQRAMTNQLCRLSRAKYVMKVDAHCSFDQGFDRKMLDAFREAGDDVTMVPTMRNLHVFDWVCARCGSRWYQGGTPSQCMRELPDQNRREPNGGCDSKEFRREVVWRAKRSPNNCSYRFDSEPHFQYWKEYTKRPGWGGDLVESMSIQGSCFMLTRERYWALDICDESLGSWGSQGIEVACKTWLSGGRVLVNRKTWYAHLFRTQPGFGFPYPQDEEKVQAAKAKARDLFFGNRWPGQVYPLSWLLKKFWPIPGWSDEDLRTLEAYGDPKAAAPEQDARGAGGDQG